MSLYDDSYPPFAVPQISCIYPLGARYSGLQRILYYCLLAACFVTQHHGWLNKVFLGASYSFAAATAINVFILAAKQNVPPAPALVDIPLISNSTYNETILSELRSRYPNLREDISQLSIVPASMNLDLDGMLAICVTGFLVVLPMQCWSGAVRANRVRYLLVSMWSALMLVASVCVLYLWPRLFKTPPQYAFCMPPFSDITPTKNMFNVGWNPSFWRGDWNSTIWNIFTDMGTFGELGESCLNPCFNTSEVLRTDNRLTATLQMKESGRWGTDTKATQEQLDKEEDVRNLVYTVVFVTMACNFFLLIITHVHGVTKIPLNDPRRLWKERTQIWSTLKNNARKAFTKSNSADSWTSRRQLSLDIILLLVLLFAMVVSPMVLIVFIVWVEHFLRCDLTTTPYVGVGQWGTTIQLVFVLFAALVIRFRYAFAARSDIESEMKRIKDHYEELAKMLKTKTSKTRQESIGSQNSAAAVVTQEPKREEEEV